MSLDFKTLRRERENFYVDSTAPVYIPGGVVSANDMASLAAWFEISGPSAGLGGAPGTATIEYTPDDGTTWETVPGTVGGSITGAGSNFNIQTTANTGIFPPVIRFKFVAPAGQYYNVVHIRRSYVTPGLVAALRSPAGSPVTDFGVVTSASRVAAMLGSIDKAPVPNVVGYQYVTSTGFTKTLAGDGRAIDVNIAASSFAFSAQMQINYAGTPTVPAFYPATPASNKPIPTVQVAGDGLGIVTMGSGADSVLTPRVTLSTRHEDVTTPLAFKLSDGTEIPTAHETYALNTQFVKAAQTLRLPVSAFLNGWDYTNNTRKELRTNASGDLRVEQGNTLIPTAYDYFSISYAGATSDVYTYKTGGSGGTTVATITMNYTDATKNVLSSVART